jgi:HAD superfamily hydrolase (TIGR01509 family)
VGLTIVAIVRSRIFMNINDIDFNQYQAIFFDLDGTLINSMPYHNEAWLETLRENQVNIEITFLQETAGLSIVRIVNIINERFNKSLDPLQVAETKKNKFLEKMHQVQTITPVMDIVTKYHGVIPMGVITGGFHVVVDKILPQLDIAKYFDSLVCADDTEKGKDTVAPYQLACSQLGVSPDQCLFLDDGDVGLKGAMLAGMDVIHVDVNHPEIFVAKHSTQKPM